MTRMDGADPSKQGLFQGLFTRVIYSLTKHKVGRRVMPVRIAAHHAKQLWGYGQMERESRLRTLESCAWRRWWGVELTSVPRSAGPRASRKKKDRSTRDYATTPLFFRTRRSWFWNMPKLRAKFTDSQLVELTDRLAWENYRARYDDAFGIEAEGFTKGSDCAMPVGGARKSRAATP